MPSLVKLQNGEIIHAEMDAAALVTQFNNSRRDGTLIKVDPRDGGGPVWINPHVLSTIEPAPESVYEERGVLTLGEEDERTGRVVDGERIPDS